MEVIGVDDSYAVTNVAAPPPQSALPRTDSPSSAGAAGNDKDKVKERRGDGAQSAEPDESFEGDVREQEGQIENKKEAVVLEDGRVRIPIRALVSAEIEEIGDGEGSFGSAESFDSALDRMAESPTASNDAFLSPKGSSSGFDSAPVVWSSLEVAQRGALMRLNELNSGHSSLDVSVISNSTSEEDFRAQVGKIVERNDISANDATVRNILELLVPLVRKSSISAKENGNADVDTEKDFLAGNETPVVRPVAKLTAEDDPLPNIDENVSVDEDSEEPGRPEIYAAEDVAYLEVQEAKDQSDVETLQSAQGLPVVGAEEIGSDDERLSSPASGYPQSKTNADEEISDADVDHQLDIKAENKELQSHSCILSDVSGEKLDLLVQVAEQQLADQESLLPKSMKDEFDRLIPEGAKLKAQISLEEESEVHKLGEEDLLEVQQNVPPALEEKEQYSESELPPEVEPEHEEKNEISPEQQERKGEEPDDKAVIASPSTELEVGESSDVLDFHPSHAGARDLEVTDGSEEVKGGLEAEDKTPVTLETDKAYTSESLTALKTEDRIQRSVAASDFKDYKGVDLQLEEAKQECDTAPLEDLVSTSVPLASSRESGDQLEMGDTWQEFKTLAEKLVPNPVNNEEDKAQSMVNESSGSEIVDQKSLWTSKRLDLVPPEIIVQELPDNLLLPNPVKDEEDKTDVVHTENTVSDIIDLKSELTPTRLDLGPTEIILKQLPDESVDIEVQHQNKIVEAGVFECAEAQLTEDVFSALDGDVPKPFKSNELESLLMKIGTEDQKSLSVSDGKGCKDTSTTVQHKEGYENGSSLSLVHEERSLEPVQSASPIQLENRSRVDSVKSSVVGTAFEDEDNGDNRIADDDKDDEDDGSTEKSAILATLVRVVDSSKGGSGSPLLGSAGPSLPARPVGLGRSTPSLEPALRYSQQSNSNGVAASQPPVSTENNQSNVDKNDGNSETREKLHAIKVKFLRLAHRFGQTAQNVLIAQVLYRLGLAEQLRVDGSTGTSTSFSSERASAIAEEQESAGQEDLDFTCTILLLGKTGVGKSATINSIFDEVKAPTNAFTFGTQKVQEIIGTVHGIKLRIIDTPGLWPSVADQRQNEKIMASVKRFIQRCSPDIVLYFDRLDMQSRDFGDLPLLRTITDTFGAAIWFNAIIVLTHASCAPPDGPNGVPLSYDMFVSHRSHTVQQAVRQASHDMRLMNPVSLVENHPACRTNRAGEKVLPNGQVWKSQLLLLSVASKILADANSLFKLQENTPGRPFGTRSRVPPLPFLLSSLLQSRAQLKMPDEQSGEGESEEDIEDNESDDEVDYDELPPFRRLKKEEIEELDKEQRRLYFEEVEDREKLFQKKQWKEELKRRKELKKRMEGARSADMPSPEEMSDGDGAKSAAIPVALPDMALPPTFDSDNPSHRYRYLDTASQWLVRPVLETHGWDHDNGYDGINLEKMFTVGNKVPVSLSSQITKDKKETNITLESAASLRHGEGNATLVGFDVQPVGKDLSYTLRSETCFSNFKRNKTIAGLALTMLGDTIAAGLKLEDRLAIGKGLKLFMNGGAVTGRGDVSCGGTLEITIRDKDYPISRTLSTLGFSVMNWHGDLAAGTNLQSQFVLGKTMMILRANLNNRATGQISIKASSSEQPQMALIGLVPIVRALFGNRLFRSSYSNQ